MLIALIATVGLLAAPAAELAPARLAAREASISRLRALSPDAQVTRHESGEIALVTQLAIPARERSAELAARGSSSPPAPRARWPG